MAMPDYPIRAEPDPSQNITAKTLDECKAFAPLPHSRASLYPCLKGAFWKSFQNLLNQKN